jgi:hypothetical protein
MAEYTLYFLLNQLINLKLEDNLWHAVNNYLSYLWECYAMIQEPFTVAL